LDSAPQSLDQEEKKGGNKWILHHKVWIKKKRKVVQGDSKRNTMTPWERKQSTIV
jgi:hypothetical protein